MTRTKLDTPAFANESVDTRTISDGTIQAQDISGPLSNAKLTSSSFTINGSPVSLGGSASVTVFLDWQAVTVADGSTQLTAESNKGYFLDTNAGVIEVFLPTSPSTGDTIGLVDYSGTFATNQLIINTGGKLIDSTTGSEFKVQTNNSIVELVYVDANKGWQVFLNQAAGTTPDGTLNRTSGGGYDTQVFVAATGGTITTSGDFKIHTFTGDGCFVVSRGGAGAQSDVDYLVVGGGGSGSDFIGGGGGAGGFRTSNSLGLPSPTTSPLASPTGLTVTAQTYPITVGSGASTTPNSGNLFPSRKGSDSVFSTITSAGGGGAGFFGGEPTKGKGGDGGSGGGADYNCWPSPPVPGGSGNTPPVSPPQGNAGGTANVFGPQDFGNGGGGGAGAVGGNVTPGSNCAVAGSGGIGSFVSTSFAVSCAGTPGPVSGTRYFAGGGGAGRGRSYHTAGLGGAGGGANGCTQPTPVNGTANTGGGGGGATYPAAGGSQTDGSGGKGIVLIRYKFQ